MGKGGWRDKGNRFADVKNRACKRFVKENTKHQQKRNYGNLLIWGGELRIWITIIGYLIGAESGLATTSGAEEKVKLYTHTLNFK